jgi:putative FmdB family regulatory protein
MRPGVETRPAASPTSCGDHTAHLRLQGDRAKFIGLFELAKQPETMPTYEYACPAGHEFEKFQKITERPRAKCPTCGKAAIRKISGGAGLVFKGSGFYITDYGKDGKGPRKAEATEAPKDTKDTKDTKADSTPKADAKSESKKSDKPAKKAAE